MKIVALYMCFERLVGKKDLYTVVNKIQNITWDDNEISAQVINAKSTETWKLIHGRWYWEQKFISFE